MYSLRLFFITFLLVGTGTASAQSVDEAQTALKDIHAKIEREEGRLQSIDVKQSELESKLTSLSKEREALDRRRTELQNNGRALDARVEKLERAVEKGKKAVDVQREELHRRVVAVYKMQRRAGAFDYLIRSASATDLLRRLSYLTRIAAQDRSKLDRLAGFVQDFERERNELKVAKEERAKALEQSVQLQREIELKVDETASATRELESQKQAAESSLVELRRSAERLESMLANLMGGKQQPPVTAEEPAPKPAAEFDGVGLTSLKGALSLPIPGAKLVQRFGRQKHEEFADMVFVKGLEFVSPVGSKVRAVAPGRVALTQVLPGYGNVMILDHGKRQYTLYGRLDKTLKTLGTIVQTGDEIATVGQPDNKRRNFYFELRIQGKPVNPMDYFRERPANAPS